MVDEKTKLVKNRDWSLDLLAQSAARLVQLQAHDNLFAFIAKELNHFVKPAFAMINEYDQAAQVMVVRHFWGFSNSLQKAMQLIGQHPVGMTQPIREEDKSEIVSGALTKIEGGLFRISFQKIPRSVCVVIEKTLNIGDFYGMGFVLEGKILGATVFGLKRGVSIDTPIVETFGNIVASVWQRLRVEKEKLELQERLIQSQKLEAIGRLAGGVAHDFNNLLTAILGNVSYAMSDLHPQGEVAELLEEIQGAANKAANVARQLLAFSRKQIIEPRTIQCNQLLLNLQKMINRLLGEQISIAWHLSDVDLWVKVDPGQLEQVIMNIAINARDAMPTGGKMMLSTDIETIEDQNREKQLNLSVGHYAVISITDTGYGMSQDVLNKIFEPFFTTKQKYVGTGLGLATSFGIMRQHGGTLVADSQLETGTTLKMYLPLVEPGIDTTAHADTHDEINPIQGNEIVLLVEDEEAVRTIAYRILNKQGYHVYQAENGIDALALVAKEKIMIDLLLTDVVMPHMNGHVLAQELKTLQPQIQVLYTSGYTEDIVEQHGAIAKGLNFLKKPYTPDQLLLTIRKLLDT